ncbi:YncE family protein [Rhodanobacter sp. DHB23]|uniref:YncE family protein n=1 Tax=Rhodanobacter sp. DHB23 TaxID=2775923 RepID=UPI0017833945|nr:YncE family protein [Rhodanobacter sp. DHB23]MBD8872266.1 YncE family protein [Rhodanobacter sp. DHB23]
MKSTALLLFLAIGAATTAQAATPDYAVLQRHPLGGSGGWDYLTIDPAAHHLLIARTDRVMVVDTQDGKLAGEIAGMQHIHGIALVQKARRGYVSDGTANSVHVIDLDGLKNLRDIPIGGKGPDAIVFDPASGHVLTMNGHSGDASVIDPASNKAIAEIALPGRPEFAVSDGHGHVYANIEDKSELARIDTRTDKVDAVWKLAPCDSPSGLAIDTQSRRLFSVCDNKLMVVTDADDGHQVATAAIGDGPDAARFDPATGLVYSSNHDGTLTIVHEDDANHYSVVANVPTQAGARTMALDQATHRIWLVAAAPAPRHAQVKDFTALVVGSH